MLDRRQAAKEGERNCLPSAFTLPVAATLTRVVAAGALWSSAAPRCFFADAMALLEGAVDLFGVSTAELISG